MFRPFKALVHSHYAVYIFEQEGNNQLSWSLYTESDSYDSAALTARLLLLNSNRKISEVQIKRLKCDSASGTCETKILKVLKRETPRPSWLKEFFQKFQLSRKGCAG